MWLQQILKRLAGLSLLLHLLACGQAQERGTAAATVNLKQLYNLTEPEIFTLPESVREISGISYHKADHSVFAVDDEKGSLFKIKLQKQPTVEQWPVSGKNDYEDLVITNNTIYLLSSKGSIVFFPYAFPLDGVEQSQLSIKGKNEFEVLLKDPTADRLLMMCKDCREDRTGEVSVFSFSLAAKKFASKRAGILKVSEIESLLQNKVGPFKPSAANVHPSTGDFYIVSSINKLLVVTDQSFRVKDVYTLRADLFPQPEGLCFTPSGDLLIANEAAGKGGSATILMFKQRQ